MVVRVASMLIGCVILAAGMSIVINSNAGTGPNDLVAVILSDKIEKVEFRLGESGMRPFLRSPGLFPGRNRGSGNHCGGMSYRAAGTVLASYYKKACKCCWSVLIYRIAAVYKGTIWSTMRRKTDVRRASVLH